MTLVFMPLLSYRRARVEQFSPPQQDASNAEQPIGDAA
jgi:hypothetical protein